jgi:hypothetical protein
MPEMQGQTHEFLLLRLRDGPTESTLEYRLKRAYEEVLQVIE